MESSYHHGDLRSVAIRAAADAVGSAGTTTLGLRRLSRQLGVAHTALTHHFGSLTGLFTAVAAEGHRVLAADLRETEGQPFVEAGVAYVTFAVEHPGYFEVMFQPDLCDPEDPALLAARQGTFDVLTAGVRALQGTGRDPGDAAAAVIAGWSLVHGLATLALNGNLDAADVRDLVAGGDLTKIARTTAGMLFGSPGGAK